MTAAVLDAPAPAASPDGHLAVEILDFGTGTTRTVFEDPDAHDVLQPLAFTAAGAQVRVLQTSSRATSLADVALDGSGVVARHAAPRLGIWADVRTSPSGDRAFYVAPSVHAGGDALYVLDLTTNLTRPVVGASATRTTWCSHPPRPPSPCSARTASG
jgi:hypothetical protein